MKILALSNGKTQEVDVETGASPAWLTAGNCLAAFGNGDPVLANWHYNGGTVTGPTPAQVTTSIARCVKFRLPKLITATGLRFFSIAAVSEYRFAIYDLLTGLKIWESNPFTTAANDWNALSINYEDFVADNDYLFCMTVVGTGTTSAFRSFPAPIHANYYSSFYSPLGNLSIGLPAYAQFNVSSGVFPATLPTINAAQYAGSDFGTIPLAFLTAF